MPRRSEAKESRERKRPEYMPTRLARRAEDAALSSTDDLAPLLDALGIVYRQADAGRKLTAKCPSPSHRDRGPSWFINNDPNDERFGTHHCQSCRFRGGPVALACRAEGGVGDWERAASLLSDLFGGGDGGVDIAIDRSVARRRRPVRRVVEFDLPGLGMVPSAGTPGGAYLSARGVLPWQQAVLGSMWAPPRTTIPRPEGKPLSVSRRVALPVVVAGRVRTFAARAVRKGAVPKYLYPPAPRDRLLWGLHLWSPAGRAVGLCEGIIDAWAVHLVLGIPCFAVLGSRMTHAQAALLRTADSLCAFWDPNAAGEKLPEDVRTRLPSVTDVSMIRALPRGMDAGDAIRLPGDPSRLDPDVLRESYEMRRSIHAAVPRNVLVEYRRHTRRRP